MFRNYMILCGKKYFRGVYKTKENAIRYGKKDFNKVDDLLTLEAISKDRNKKTLKMFTEDEDHNIVFNFRYSYL